MEIIKRIFISVVLFIVGLYLPIFAVTIAGFGSIGYEELLPFCLVSAFLLPLSVEIYRKFN